MCDLNVAQAEGEQTRVNKKNADAHVRLQIACMQSARSYSDDNPNTAYASGPNQSS